MELTTETKMYRKAGNEAKYFHSISQAPHLFKLTNEMLFEICKIFNQWHLTHGKLISKEVKII